MISENELYNLYLSVSRSSRSKPFKLRTNFDGFDETESGVYIKKIATFLSKYPQIKPYAYFKAPFELYPDEEYFDLSYFCSQKAVKAYTTYMKRKLDQSPDNEEQIQFIKDSIHFIGMFCLKNKISINDYLTYKTGSIPYWVDHLKSYNISIYSLLEFSDLSNIIYTLPKDIKEMAIPEIVNNLHIYKSRYISSVNAKNVVKEGIKIIKRYCETR